VDDRGCRYRSQNSSTPDRPCHNRVPKQRGTSGYCILHAPFPTVCKSKSYNRIVKQKSKEFHKKKKEFDKKILKYHKKEQAGNSKRSYYDFEGVRLEKVEFYKKHFQPGELNFNEAEILGDVSFRSCTIPGNVSFYGALIGGAIDFTGSMIGGDLSFGYIPLKKEEKQSNGDTKAQELIRKRLRGEIKEAVCKATERLRKANNTKEGKNDDLKRQIERELCIAADRLRRFKESEKTRDELKKRVNRLVSLIWRKEGSCQVSLICGTSFSPPKHLAGSLSFDGALFADLNNESVAFRTAKKVLEKIGDREHEDYHFFREKEAIRKEPTRTRSRKFADWFAQFFFGYGVKMRRLVRSWLLIIIIFACFYLPGEIMGAGVTSIILGIVYAFSQSSVMALIPGSWQGSTNLSLSIFTFVEAVLATVVWFAFLATLARKYMR
jgi:hypothetical protein